MQAPGRCSPSGVVKCVAVAAVVVIVECGVVSSRRKSGAHVPASCPQLMPPSARIAARLIRPGSDVKNGLGDVMPKLLDAPGPEAPWWSGSSLHSLVDQSRSRRWMMATWPMWRTFAWRFIKSDVYQVKINSIQQLKQRIRAAAAKITRAMFVKVFRSVVERWS